MSGQLINFYLPNRQQIEPTVLILELHMHCFIYIHAQIVKNKNWACGLLANLQKLAIGSRKGIYPEILSQPPAYIARQFRYSTKNGPQLETTHSPTLLPSYKRAYKLSFVLLPPKDQETKTAGILEKKKNTSGMVGAYLAYGRHSSLHHILPIFCQQKQCTQNPPSINIGQIDRILSILLLTKIEHLFSVTITIYYTSLNNLNIN